jgi:hypothetical protein
MSDGDTTSAPAAAWERDCWISALTVSSLVT